MADVAGGNSGTDTAIAWRPRMGPTPFSAAELALPTVPTSIWYLNSLGAWGLSALQRLRSLVVAALMPASRPEAAIGPPSITHARRPLMGALDISGP